MLVTTVDNLTQHSRIGHSRPRLRHIECEAEGSFHVGLVKAWEHRARPVGDKQGVKEIIVAVE